jgi:hypothetical protein
MPIKKKVPLRSIAVLRGITRDESDEGWKMLLDYKNVDEDEYRFIKRHADREGLLVVTLPPDCYESLERKIQRWRALDEGSASS